MKSGVGKKDILHFNNELDVLYFYSEVSKILINFLKGKQIASKIHLKELFFVVRGNKEKPIYIEDFSSVDKKMLDLRKNHLDEVREQLNEKQQIIWKYFPPRKLVQFFYATNNEGVGKPISRIFIDIDKKNFSSEVAQKVAYYLAQEIKQDKEFNQMLKYKMFLLWTGNSFHIYLTLKKPVDIDFYNEYLSYGKGKEKSFLVKWASNISEKLKIKVEAGHEKTKNKIILDSSNTPSGKLARAPFSLHIKNYKEFDGIAIPISEESLTNKNLVRELRKLTPEKVIKSLEDYRKLLE